MCTSMCRVRAISTAHARRPSAFSIDDATKGGRQGNRIHVSHASESAAEGPGDCPVCGMALEAVVVTSRTGDIPELRDMTRRLWICLGSVTERIVTDAPRDVLVVPLSPGDQPAAW